MVYSPPVHAAVPVAALGVVSVAPALVENPPYCVGSVPPSPEAAAHRKGQILLVKRSYYWDTMYLIT